MRAESVQHYIVARGRIGWTVAAGPDRLSEHASPDEARREAHEMAERDRRCGRPAEVIDLAEEQPNLDLH